MTTWFAQERSKRRQEEGNDLKDEALVLLGLGGDLDGLLGQHRLGLVALLHEIPQEQINNSPQERKNRNRNRNQSNASPAAGRRRGDPPSVGRRPPRWRPAATPPPPRPPPPTPSLPNKARTFETRPRPLEDVKLPSPLPILCTTFLLWISPLPFPLLSLGFNDLFIQSHGVPMLTA